MIPTQGYEEGDIVQFQRRKGARWQTGSIAHVHKSYLDVREIVRGAHGTTGGGTYAVRPEQVKPA